MNKHNSLTHIIQLLAAKAGIASIYEPVQCFKNNNSGMKPDIRLIKPGFALKTNCERDILVDVSVTFPASVSYINTTHSDTVRGATALVRENKKHNDYAKLSDNNNHNFLAAVFESYGTWGEELVKLFDSLTKVVWCRGGKRIPYGRVKEYWTLRLSCALQIMNARMFLGRSSMLAGGKILRQDEAYYDTNIIDCLVRVPLF